MISADFIGRTLTAATPEIVWGDEEESSFQTRRQGFAPRARAYPQDMAQTVGDPLHGVYKSFSREKDRRRKDGIRLRWNEYLKELGLGTPEAVRRWIRGKEA